ncbi:hypothetical protein LOK49_LG10G00107 [Camellia lanceoleosa]|uniref:Uncharacterized protein n=1 Tax=Camellia lanceoleosa TaxID=1840588 RepID=A0ACC0GC34_9ERIC|nr:hypothetical protein LOK49_LG10G00107 [Camellia lanceoleosa]
MGQSQTQSTPSKTLHKRGSKQTQQQSVNVHEAAWDSDTVRIFLELVIKELDIGFKRSFHTMTMHGYRAVCKGFQERTNKWAHYEKVDVIFSLVDKNAIKFKTKPLEHMDLMRRVSGASDSGKYAWTPGAAFEPIATDNGTSPMDEEDCEDSSGLPPF